MALIVMAAGITSAFTIWTTGRRLNTQRVKITEAGESRYDRRYDLNHWFFFIPFEYWAIPTLLFSIWIAWLR